MNDADLPWLIALTQVPNIGPVHARLLLQHLGTAKDVFKASKRSLECISGIGTVRAESVRNWRDFTMAEKEIRFMEQYRIQAIAQGEPGYPHRLAQCFDAPILLYYRGNASLNAERIISIIGTRTPTEYGKDRVKDLLSFLSAYQPLVISGLAYGIDTLAHKYALKQSLQTVGVLAHGLDRIYPQTNKSLARAMTEAGGLLTDFPSGTNPDAVNFPRRNRIVAGISDAVIVVETGEKGGSMITARMANGYDREVMAIPGRITDAKSSGCLLLIKEHRAQLLSDPTDISTIMNWDQSLHKKPVVEELFSAQLSLPEKKILDFIREKGNPSLDDIRRFGGQSVGDTAGILLSLEMNQLIVSMPGNRFRSVG